MYEYKIPSKILFIYGKLSGIEAELVGVKREPNNDCYIFQIEIEDGFYIETPNMIFKEIDN